MKPHDESLSDVPGIEPGEPGYVALVIDFDDMGDVYDDFEQIDELDELDAFVITGDVAPRHPMRVIGAVLGVVGALAIAAWGLRRLRA